MNSKKIDDVLIHRLDEQELFDPKFDAPQDKMNDRLNNRKSNSEFYTGHEKTKQSDIVAMQNNGRLTNEAREMVEGPFMSGITQATAGIYDAGVMKRRRRRKNEYDGDINIDAYMAADPNVFTKTTKVDKKGKRVVCLLNLTFPASVSSQEVTRIMVKISTKIISLIKSGYTVEVQGLFVTEKPFYSTEGKNANMDLIVTHMIKEARAPLDMERLMCAAHSSYLRVNMFRAAAISGYHFRKDIRLMSGIGKVIDSRVVKRGNPNAITIMHTMFKNIKEIANCDSAIYFDRYETEGVEVKDFNLSPKELTSLFLSPRK